MHSFNLALYFSQNYLALFFSRLPIPNSRFPTPDSRFPTPDSRFPIPDPLLGGVRGGFRFPIPDSRFPQHFVTKICKICYN
ncbi:MULTISPECIES: hypothetical protein [unclassified Moorena]|uniref:hypothetical protein n=1 Tax=unclassified Moorena TaxID=2683338 RepID=UPI0013B7FF25|nr:MULTISPECIES: hypothetical protein [unclassified Moorena]NEP37129.1 hypothetical protein [Moorena sp. SIO3B2]NER91758.1 hypothetical protein [Moorena sp. SIO3A2]